MAGTTVGAAQWTEREREVRELLAAGERDGLSVRETAARSGVPAGTLAWWRSEIRRRDAARRASSATPEFVEVVTRRDDAPPPARAGRDGEFAPGETATFVVELRGGLRVHVPAAYGLARLVREIERC